MRVDVYAEVDEELADDDRLDELSHLLRKELLELDDAIVQPVPDRPPPLSKSGLGSMAGALVVSVQPTLEALGALVAAIRAWLAGRTQRSVRLEVGGDVLELTGTTSELQQRLAEEWIRIHAAE